jgi:hypothetical protein
VACPYFVTWGWVLAGKVPSAHSQLRKTNIDRSEHAEERCVITHCSSTSWDGKENIRPRSNTGSMSPLGSHALSLCKDGDRSPMSSDLSLATHLCCAITDPPNKSSCCFQPGDLMDGLSKLHPCKLIMGSALYSNTKAQGQLAHLLKMNPCSCSAPMSKSREDRCVSF